MNVALESHEQPQSEYRSKKIMHLTQFRSRTTMHKWLLPDESLVVVPTVDLTKYHSRFLHSAAARDLFAEMLLEMIPLLRRYFQFCV